MDSIELTFIVLMALLLLLGSGVWIAISLMACGWLTMALYTSVPIGKVMAVAFWDSSASWTLAALPLFIWMGEILFRTKLSEEIFRGLAPWLGWLPGRLMHINVIGCGIFGSVSGSSAATTATIAKIALPELNKRGYDEYVSLGSLAGAGTLGILIPPSITMVVYAVAADVSIIQLFLAGFLPGLLVMILYSGYISGWALLNPQKQPPPEPAMTMAERLKESQKLIPTALLIIFITLTLIFGWATATECAAWGVVGSLAIAAFSRSLTLETFWQSIMGTVRMTCMIMMILAAASFLSKAMAFTGIPRDLAAFVGELHLSPYALIGALTLMYIVLGTALDGISMIVLTTVVVLPLVKQAGFDLVWFGIFMILVIEMAEVSPPVGFNLFVLQTMSGRDSLYVAKASLPFFFLLVIAVTLITLFPEIVSFLPLWAFPPTQG